MFAYKGRGGPSRSTPANVQCQKCLKRGHYSYDCKASAQERPYVSRPSRSQQLRNPKLVPKLTSDVPNPLEKKEGVADEELAKIEAERLRKRELEEHEDELIESSFKRRRSVSSHSVSTISTDASRASPPPRKRTRSPTPQRRGRSLSSGSDDEQPTRRSYSRSPPPPRRRQRSVSRSSRSPRREGNERDYRDRRRRPTSDRERDASPDQQPRQDSHEPRRGPNPRRNRPRAWGSPDHQDQPYKGRDDRGPRRRDTRGDRGEEGRSMPVEQAPRERSLSPVQ